MTPDSSAKDGSASRRRARRSHRYTWMLNGWTDRSTLGERDGGTEFMAISVPDDFVAVRVGLANMHAAPWKVRKIIACASSSWNDSFNPIRQQNIPREAAEWSTLTFRHGGASVASVVTDADAPTEITIAGNRVNSASGVAENPSWTFTDWVPCASAGADPVTGMRVLMLRALVPGKQTVTHTRGLMVEYSGSPAVNKGYRYFIGGLKQDTDLVSDPVANAIPGMTTPTVYANHLVNGQLMAMVQVLTRNAGVTAMMCGDSHQAGSSTTSGINNFLTQCMLDIGSGTIGATPIGIANTAVGGLISRQIFPRMIALLHAIRPGFVVLPGWSANDLDANGRGGAGACDTFFARMLLAAETIQDSGTIPVLLTPMPRDPEFMAHGSRHWLAQREIILRLARSGTAVFDVAPLLSATRDDAMTGTYANDLSSDDIHPNDVGHQLLSQAFMPLARDLIGLPGTE